MEKYGSVTIYFLCERKQLDKSLANTQLFK